MERRSSIGSRRSGGRFGGLDILGTKRPLPQELGMTVGVKSELEKTPVIRRDNPTMSLSKEMSAYATSNLMSRWIVSIVRGVPHLVRGCYKRFHKHAISY